MLTNYFRDQFKSNACRFLVLILLMLVAMPLFAQGADQGSIPNIVKHATNLNASVFTRIVEQIPNFMRLVTAIAYVMGMFFIFTAIVKVKHFGETRTMTSKEHSIMTPIIMLVVGTALIYLPSSVQVGMSTFWSNLTPYAYLDQQQDQWLEVMKGCFLIIQLIGTIAFIRGLVLINVYADHGGQANSTAKPPPMAVRVK
jgi:hypothetical protein